MSWDGDEHELLWESAVAKVARRYNKKVQAKGGEAVVAF